jgi:hypothetical protein
MAVICIDDLDFFTGSGLSRSAFELTLSIRGGDMKVDWKLVFPFQQR